MKKVRFLTSVSSVDGSYANGEIATLPANVADQWVSSGLVELVADAKPAAAPVAAPAPVPEAPVAVTAAPAPSPSPSATPAKSSKRSR